MAIGISDDDLGRQTYILESEEDIHKVYLISKTIQDDLYEDDVIYEWMHIIQKVAYEKMAKKKVIKRHVL